MAQPSMPPGITPAAIRESAYESPSGAFGIIRYPSRPESVFIVSPRAQRLRLGVERRVQLLGPRTERPKFLPVALLVPAMPEQGKNDDQPVEELDIEAAEA